MPQATRRPGADHTVQLLGPHGSQRRALNDGEAAHWNPVSFLQLQRLRHHQRNANEYADYYRVKYDKIKSRLRQGRHRRWRPQP